MTTAEVNGMIESISLPYAYYDFLDKDKPAPPYLCFFYPEGHDVYADGENYDYVDELALRVYRSRPDLHGDRQICRTLNDNGLTCRWERWYDTETRLWVTEYRAEVGISEPEAEES